MDKYRSRQKNIIELHKDLEERISTLERNPRVGQSSVNSGSLIFNGGLLEVKTGNPLDSPMFLVFGTNSVSGGTPNQVAITRVTRNGSIQYDALRFTDGSGVGSGGGSIAIIDRYGQNIVSDAFALNARGMSDPRLNTNFYDSNALTTFTGASFANYRSAFWYMYHPHLRVRVLCQVDAATTGEIRVNENGGQQQAISTLTASMNAYVDLIVDRRNTINGNGPNGNIATLDIEVRRTTGAGNVKVAFAEAIGIDLSINW